MRPITRAFMPENNAFSGICSCVTACTGRFASFFVNIGRADTLGSGMRNLYKYTKLYSNAEPILSEGDVFEMRIPLKKSDVEAQKSDIETKKSDIEAQKSDIRNNKLTLEQLLNECGKRSYNMTVTKNMITIHSTIAVDQIFGESDVVKILGCSRSTASDLMKRLKDANLVVPIQGKGKGKYRLKYETEMIE